MAKPIPDGWHTVTPRLFVEAPERLAGFFVSAFGAVEAPRFREDAPIEFTRGATSSFFYLYVPDTDATYRTAVAAGARSLEEPEMMFYGDRRAMSRT
jgi:PhnB protein